MNKQLEEALAQIILKVPPFAIITSSWKELVETNEVPTMGVDGKNLYYNLEFTNKLSNENLIAVLVHEIYHCVFLHPHEITKVQEQGKIRTLWEIALEIVTNAAVVDTGLGKLPGRALSPFTENILHNTHKQNIYFYDSMGHTHTAQEVYEKLVEKYKDNLDKFEMPITVFILGEDGESMKIPIPTVGDIIGNPNKGELQENIEKSIAVIEKMEKTMKDKGNFPAGLERLLKKLKLAKTPWNRILQNFVGTIVKGAEDFSWNHPNWRHPLSDKMIIPGEVEYTQEDIVTVIDTSGSISDKEIESFCSEIAKLTQYTDDVTVITCDAQIHEKVKIRNIWEFMKKIKFKGGGGTDFRPVFQTVKNCACMLFFTDGYGDYPDTKPKYPVLWILTKDHQKPPFGKVCHIINE